MAARKKNEAQAGDPRSGGLPDLLLIAFLLLYGLLVFWQNPFVGVVMIVMAVFVWRANSRFKMK